MKKNNKGARILVVDDEARVRHLLSIMLERKGYQVFEAADGLEALTKLKTAGFDMMLSDIKMPHMDGMALLKKLKDLRIICPTVIITAFATVDSAVAAMRQGAVDYISKPFDEDRILLTIERTLQLSKVLEENKELKKELNYFKEEEIIYVSKPMQILMDLAAKVAVSDSAVLINGESGTGKELLARFIHNKSQYHQGRFVPVNCAAISPHLVESELFGHEKGAFTGADRRTIGKFEFASGGTIFLDEIGDLPLEAQAKLLRALQEKNIQRVGGNDEVAVNARVVCATNRNLPDLVESEDFRKDLFFRINVFPIQPPPLRERMDDIVPLTNHFLQRLCGTRMELTPGGIKTLMAYSWPGNVRELANFMERAVILAGNNNTIDEEILSFMKQFPAEAKSFKLPPEGINLEEVEKNFVNQAMEYSQNNQTVAAGLLGISRAKFRVMLKTVKNNK